MGPRDSGNLKPFYRAGYCIFSLALMAAFFAFVKDWVPREVAWSLLGMWVASIFVSYPLLLRLDKKIRSKDIVARELAERTERLLFHQKTLFDLTKTEIRDLPSFLRLITEVSAQTLGVERVSVWFFSAEGDAFECHDLYSSSQNTHQSGITLRTSDYPRYFAALRETSAIVADDAREDPHTSEFREHYLKPLGITSMMDIPIRRDRKVVAVICHEHVGPPRTWTVEEKDFSLSLSDMMSLVLETLERRKAEEDLKAANRELKRLNDIKSQFTSMVSHELRTPLSSIRESIDLVMSGIDGPVNDEQLHTLGIAKRNIDRLARLITDILAYSSLESGKIQMQFGRADVADIVKDVCQTMRTSVESRGIRLIEGPRESRIVHCDEDKIKQVLINFINNSMRFTPKAGEIRLSVEAAAPDGFIRISVVDTGLGIAPEDQQRIFEIYTQVGPDKPLKDGTGVGLAVCKLIMDQHGGRIEVESQPHKGSRFSICLPGRA